MHGETGLIYKLLPYPTDSLFYPRDHKIIQAFHTKLVLILGW